jgi:aminomuconate-semialdehyde/2-hydroxymuconate-6-semialdehyde dehydrogenase
MRQEAIDQLPLYIGGKFVQASGGRTFDNRNPATDQLLARIAEASTEDVDRAARAARDAFEKGLWARASAAERARVLRQIADLMEAHKDELARLESLDTGKPLREAAAGDIPRAIGYFRVFADYVTTQGTEFYPMDGQALNYVLREPLGVAGLITPWNFPLMTLCSKLAPALSTGNSVVAKPAEWTPMTASRFAELLSQSALPEGVFNLVHGFGPQAAGEAITTHPDVHAISFTGETTTGQAIMAAAARTLKRISFELGGKGATLVFADSDFEQSVNVAMLAGFKNQGQVCTAGSRILVEDSIYDRFLEAIVARARAIRVGDPLDPQTEMGSLVHAEHRARVQTYLDFARSTDMRILCGGNTPPNAPSANFLEPTVIAEPNPQARLCQEEIFGPVVTVTPFKSEDEAVAIHNSTKYGLASTVCSNNLSRAHRVAARLQTGTVWVNAWSIRDPRVPFGGYKASGLGREGGLHSLDFFTEVKTVCVKM